MIWIVPLQDIEKLSWERFELRKLDANIELQNETIQKNNNLRLGVYEDLQNGILTRDEFISMKLEFASRIAEAQKVIEQLTHRKSEIQHGLSKQQSWLAQFREYENISEVTRSILVSLVERIKVFENSEIEVVFRHKDQFTDILTFLEAQKTHTHSESKVIPMPRLEVV